METPASAGIAGPEVLRNILVVSQVRFLRDMLIEFLSRAGGMQLCGATATLEDALASVQANVPAIVLLDTAFPSGTVAAERIAAAAPEALLIALGLCEEDLDVISWAEAGIAGYVPNTASADDLISCIRGVVSGEQPCSSRIAGSLLRHVAHARRSAPLDSTGSLTIREREVLQLLSVGLSNKDIARRLAISLGTTKCHVHNLLAKLNLTRRVEVVRRRGEVF